MARASYRQSNEFFTFHNENPKGKLTSSDCVFRACGYATEGWDYAYTKLAKIGYDMKTSPNENVTYEEFLKQEGFIKCKQLRKSNNKKYIVRELAKVLKDKGKVVVRTNGHLTVVEDGHVIDTWNCGVCCAGNYWIKE